MIPESTEGAAQPQEETLDYDAELAKLNDEFSQEARPEPTKPAETSEIATLKAELAELKTHVQGDQTQKAIEAAMKMVKGDNELTISDKYLRKLVVGEVSDNPVLLKAYMNRETNPGGWKRALELVGKEINRDFGKKAATETSDIEALEASVRGQHASEQPKKIDTRNVGQMAPHEYAKWKAETLA